MSTLKLPVKSGNSFSDRNPNDSREGGGATVMTQARCDKFGRRVETRMREDVLKSPAGMRRFIDR